jgi:hypothetical protein
MGSKVKQSIIQVNLVIRHFEQRKIADAYMLEPVHISALTVSSFEYKFPLPDSRNSILGLTGLPPPPVPIFLCNFSRFHTRPESHYESTARVTVGEIFRDDE